MAKKIWYIIGGVIIIVLIVIIFNVNSKKNVSQSDITLSNFKYENQNSYVPIAYNVDNGQLEASFSLIISTQRNDLYYRIYDAKTDEEINTGQFGAYFNKIDYPSKLIQGDNKYYGYANLILNGLGDSPQLKVCISTDSKFTKDSQGVVCNIQTFSPPEFKIDITPNPLVFTVSKQKGTYDTPHKTITIKNIGNIIAPSNVFISNYIITDSTYQTPKYYPWYVSTTTTTYSWLKPGESYYFDVGVEIGNVGAFDTPVGTYETKGYVYGISSGREGCKNCVSLINSLFKKEFIVKTIVNP